MNEEVHEKFNTRAKGHRSGFDTKTTNKTIKHSRFGSKISNKSMVLTSSEGAFSLDKKKRWEIFDENKNAENLKQNNFVVVKEYGSSRQGLHTYNVQVYRTTAEVEAQMREKEEAEKQEDKEKWETVTSKKTKQKQKKQQEQAERRQAKTSKKGQAPKAKREDEEPEEEEKEEETGELTMSQIVRKAIVRQKEEEKQGKESVEIVRIETSVPPKHKFTTHQLFDPSFPKPSHDRALRQKEKHKRDADRRVVF